MTDDITLEDVKRLRLNPGDVLVVRMDCMNVEHIQTVQRHLQGAFPNNQCILLNRNTEIESIAATCQHAGEIIRGTNAGPYCGECGSPADMPESGRWNLTPLERAAFSSGYHARVRNHPRHRSLMGAPGSRVEEAWHAGWDEAERREAK
jgi:hypothetical protein